MIVLAIFRLYIDPLEKELYKYTNLRRPTLVFIAHVFVKSSDYVNPWTDFIRHTLDSCGFSNIWTEQCKTIFTVKWISTMVSRPIYSEMGI